LLTVVPKLLKAGAEVSLFIDPDARQVEASAEVGAEFVELHTGSYARASGPKRKRELARLERAARRAHELGLRVNAGHGIDYENVGPIASLPHVEELNIGFAIVARSVFTGVDEAVGRMARLVRAGRKAK
jgi:pyridoxine 5-phosphate synthase